MPPQHPITTGFIIAKAGSGIQPIPSGFVRTGASATWSPSDLGANLIAWYDATDGVFSDAGTTPAVNNDTVVQWNDLSGNDYHLTAGSAPKYITTGLNSLPSVRFADASLDYFLSANDTVVLNSNVHSCFVVIKPETGLGSNSRMLGFLGNTASVDHDNTGSVIWVLQLSGSGAFTSFANSAERVTSSAFSTGTAYRVGIIYDGSNPTLYKNNTGTTAGGAYNQTLSSPGQILIGAHQNGAPGFGEELVGDVSEVIITNIAPDATLRNTIDAYLVAKWGF